MKFTNVSYGVAFETAKGLVEEPLPRRWMHMRSVGDKALSIGRELLSEEEATVVGVAGILHDIGYSPELVQTGFHPIDGAKWLQANGWDQRIVNLVANHSCAYIEAEERGLEKEISEFSDEKTLVRELLWYSDMTTDPSGNSVSFDQRLAEIHARYGQGHIVTKFINRAESELRSSVESIENLIK